MSNTSTSRRRGGTRLRSTPEELVTRAPQSAQLLIAQWMRWMQHSFSASIWNDAVEEARQGRLASLHLGAAEATAAVRGGTRPSTVTVRFPQLSDLQRRRLIDALAGEAMSEASLLAGELPPGLLELSTSVQAPLAPHGPEQLHVVNDPKRGDAEHERAGAIVCLCALERVVNEPHLLLLLRGLPIDTVLEELRELRVMQVQGSASAHGDPFIAGTSTPQPPLEQCLDDFWGSGSMLSDLERMPPAQHAPHALLRRLGPSPLSGKFPLVGLLASVYDDVADAARTMRDRAEHIDVNGTDNNDELPRNE